MANNGKKRGDNFTDNMKIIAYEDSAFSSVIDTYPVMLNPEKLQWDRSIEYNHDAAQGTGETAPRYNKSQSEKLSFDLIIDCTGVVDSTRINLPIEINRLSKIIYDYNDKINSPNYIKINWGSLAFQCVLTRFDLSYTFFDPEGTPLRAKISLSFISAQDLATVSRPLPKAQQIIVKEGDNLPQIANQTSGSPNNYVQIARANDLDKIRQLTHGSALNVSPAMNSKVS